MLNGRDLAERSTPRELEEREDQGFTLPGRWVNSHELRCGDVLVGQDGSTRTVLKVDSEFVSAFLVHNLTIDGHHTFAVGPDAVLVHNTGGCTKRPGSPGLPDHQAKVLELLDRAEAEALAGELVLREKQIRGLPSTRRPDIQIVGVDGVTRKIYEAERHPNRARNLAREGEYIDLGVDFETFSLD